MGFKCLIQIQIFQLMSVSLSGAHALVTCLQCELPSFSLPRFLSVLSSVNVRLFSVALNIFLVHLPQGQTSCTTQIFVHYSFQGKCKTPPQFPKGYHLLRWLVIILLHSSKGNLVLICLPRILLKKQKKIHSFSEEDTPTQKGQGCV